MLTIVFYHSEGQAAKARARAISASSKGTYARCYDVTSWEGTRDKCDSVEIMPDVPEWQRERIYSVYGAADEPPPAEEPPGEVIDPNRDDDNKVDGDNEVVGEKKAVHKGGGRWFVMIGDERISGPHDKAEAIRLAGQTE